MCAGHVETAEVTGSAKGADGWFPLERVHTVYDHSFHAQTEESLIIDFVNPDRGPGARVSVELSADSAGRLIQAIQDALEDGERRHGPLQMATTA
jgi:hypothetical protein